MRSIAVLLLSCCCFLAAAVRAAPTELSIATVDNGHMVVMRKLAPEFEREHPDIRLKWTVLEEGALRQQVAADIAGQRAQYDVVTIGMYEAPIWAKKGWLKPIVPDADYDVDDLLPSIRKGLSFEGRLYAAPFYGEGSMLMYRADLLQAAGAAMPYQPTWDDVRRAAAAVHAPAKGVYGLCLRGKPGWGENMALVTTMVNTFGGQWFDMAWHPRIASDAWKKAVGTYADLLRRYGPPESWRNGFNENLRLFQQGHCAIWVDASIAASFVSDPKLSTVAGQVAYAQAPVAVTPRGAGWLWAWALAIPAATAKAEAAQRFVNWATSRRYIERVAASEGWSRIPTGTRRSTYRRPEFTHAVNFAFHEAMAIALTDPGNSTLPRSPYVGVQFAAIPEFQAIGQATGERIAQVLSGAMTLDEALQSAQAQAEAAMRGAGYFK